MAEDWQWVITAIIAFVSIIIVYIIYKKTSKFQEEGLKVITENQTKQLSVTTEHQKKQLHGSMLLKAFEALSTNQARNEREIIYSYFCHENRNPDYDKHPKIKKIVDSVELTFDKVSILIQQDYLNSEEMEKTYAIMFVKTRKALENDIKKYSKSNPDYCKNFISVSEDWNSRIKEDTEVDCERAKIDISEYLDNSSE